MDDRPGQPAAPQPGDVPHPGVTRLGPNSGGRAPGAGGGRVYAWEWGPDQARRPGLPWIGVFLLVFGGLLLARQLFPEARSLGSLLTLAVGVAFLIKWAVDRGTGSLYAGAIITALAVPGVFTDAGLDLDGLGTFCFGVAFLFIAAVLAVAIYPFWRRRATHAFEHLVTSDARRDAAIRAVEGERGRLAREIHDSPLQELSGVIRRLESMPGAESEAASLRSVAEGLRDVATSLHPPVLQDLGLAAAIADLGDHLSEGNPEWKVTVDVDDVTLADRPPADVELAAFRVIQEATANAIAHSDGRCLEIGGVVTTDTIDLRAMDDGHGFRDDDAREARRNGHFGLDAMRERAAAVGAKVVVTPGPSGAAVQFLWARR